MSSSHVKLETLLIPLEEIHLATQNFSPETLIGRGGFKVYRGQLSERWESRTAAFKRWDRDSHKGETEFRTEVEMMSSFNHGNIIPIIGFCDELNEMIIVSDYAANGSLLQHLQDPDKSRCLTWAQRLSICIGAARGLEYLYSGLGNHKRVIHRNIKSQTILLDDKLEAKICNFGFSLLVDQNQQQIYGRVAGTQFYVDPVYKESGILTAGSDVYSFGVVLFEMLSGMVAYEERSIGDDRPQTLINLVRRYHHEGLDKLIDPYIKDQVNNRSFHVFKEIAHQCISWKLNIRPTIDIIINRIKEALDFQNHHPAPTITIPRHISQNLENFLVPLEEINMATRNFSVDRCVGAGGFGEVYRGQLSERWQKRTAAFKRLSRNSFQGEREFRNELEMLSSFNHENIIPFIGYCDEEGEMIIVTEYAENRSLDDYLQNPNKIRSLTWVDRLKICMGVARGLEYLHSGLGKEYRVIHRDIKSGNILLDASKNAKICDFGMSLLIHLNQPEHYDVVAGTQFYLDPIYYESGAINNETDVYTFGVVLFEILTGMLVYSQRKIGDDQPNHLINLVRRHFHDGLENLIDLEIRAQINTHSLYEFKKIAFRCISLEIKDRPTMRRIIKRIEQALDSQIHGGASSITKRSLESYIIPLDEINSATGNFNPETLIGKGGFGVVYKGKLSESWQNCTVAIKCLNQQGHQGKKDFHAELNLISRFHHPNIIPFVGYCDEQGHMIIVYQYAVNRSLDNYLEDRIMMGSLTWAQRLNICLGAAKGLDYLHSGLGKHHRVIHRDIKSGNILLDENLEAKICDFGLSTERPRNLESSQYVTKVAGTNFYMDPIYYGSGILRKESDVYSFGVVLFEMLCGRPAYHKIVFVDGNPQHLINLVRRYYENDPERLIDPDIKDQIDSRSFHTFKEIAYQCISYISRERPTMDTIIDKIEDAIDFQELKM